MFVRKKINVRGCGDISLAEFLRPSIRRFMRLYKFNFIKNSHHEFYELKENDLIKAEDRLGFRFPKELREFYLEIGYVL